jgi:hypothetical protein
MLTIIAVLLVSFFPKNKNRDLWIAACGWKLVLNLGGLLAHPHPKLAAAATAGNQ